MLQYVLDVLRVDAMPQRRQENLHRRIVLRNYRAAGARHVHHDARPLVPARAPSVSPPPKRQQPPVPSSLNHGSDCPRRSARAHGRLNAEWHPPHCPGADRQGRHTGENKNMRHHQGGRKRMFSAVETPTLLPSASAIDAQIAKAENAVAGTAFVGPRYWRSLPGCPYSARAERSACGRHRCRQRDPRRLFRGDSSYSP